MSTSCLYAGHRDVWGFGRFFKRLSENFCTNNSVLICLLGVHCYFYQRIKPFLSLLEEIDPSTNHFVQYSI
jgi:hypothetical protein